MASLFLMISLVLLKAPIGYTVEDQMNAVSPLFHTRAWQSPGELLIRREGERQGRLLLKHRERDAVYRYDSRNKRLEIVTEGVWQNAKGVIAVCGSEVPPSPLVLHIDPKTDRLLAGNREIPTAGLTVLAIRLSPSGKWVAVLSSSSPKGDSVLPLLGRGKKPGRQYHQVLSLPDVKTVGRHLILPSEFEGNALLPCWTSDERQIVYADSLYFHLSVIDSDQPDVVK